ncbi:protein early responsive to dehydration 15 [Phtheirospermum japonicum]|uniref:Protein early responsive to dehydration 15 n=1 Tax=Phtheirospermum japonicum TaxID=374723 RepID=A0A830C8M8_9LAMI|nr:protein early responsive to dehydration 15 [Phtheirospermum japonicum]
MDFVPEESTIKVDRIEVDQETLDLLESLGMKELPGSSQVPLHFFQNFIIPISLAPLGGLKKFLKLCFHIQDIHINTKVNGVRQQLNDVVSMFTKNIFSLVLADPVVPEPGGGVDEAPPLRGEVLHLPDGGRNIQRRIQS